MPHPQFDRSQVRMRPLRERANRVLVERDFFAYAPRPLSAKAQAMVVETAARIRAARAQGRPVILAFGAHTIKNALGPTLIRLLEGQWVTHLATNGAGIIHDWEFAYLGASSENVRENIVRGEFGHWEETGFYINLALNIGAYEGRGYGESIGALIQNEGLDIPSAEQLREEAVGALEREPAQAAAAVDLLALVQRFRLPPGRVAVSHRWKHVSAQAAAFRLGIPFTGHPMFGHDIIYNHPLNHGASLGRAALRDYLTLAESISRIEGGVYLSVGSAVMSPMLFEKTFSMAQNMAVQSGRAITGHYLVVVDLAEAHWDWSRGEPPEGHPDYYLRFNKSFSRMGGTQRYVQADNRDFLPALLEALERRR